MFQKYLIVGRLTQDADLRYTQQGTPVLGFRVITSKKAKDKEYSFAIDGSLWGKLGESIAPYMKKGQLILAEGELRQESWEDRSGQKHYKTTMVADQVRLLGGKSGHPAQQNPAAQAPAPAPEDDPFADF